MYNGLSSVMESISLHSLLCDFGLGIDIYIYIYIITEDDLSNVYTVEEAVHKIGFGVFQILLSLFCGVAAVSM